MWGANQGANERLEIELQLVLVLDRSAMNGELTDDQLDRLAARPGWNN